MPTVLRHSSYRFFYSGDGGEPPHVHVERDDAEAKFWLDPVRLERSRGFARGRIGTVQALVVEKRQSLLESWHDYFRGTTLPQPAPRELITRSHAPRGDAVFDAPRLLRFASQSGGLRRADTPYEIKT